MVLIAYYKNTRENPDDYLMLPSGIFGIRTYLDGQMDQFYTLLFAFRCFK